MLRYVFAQHKNEMKRIKRLQIIISELTQKQINIFYCAKRLRS
jgi:hypothetical protein